MEGTDERDVHAQHSLQKLYRARLLGEKEQVREEVVGIG